LLIPGVEMFTSSLKLIALGFGVTRALLPQVAVFLEVLEPAFEQLELILDLLTFLLPTVAARLKKHDQFPQGTPKLRIRHDSIPSMNV